VRALGICDPYLNTTLNQEALEPAYPGINERYKIFLRVTLNIWFAFQCRNTHIVARYHASPKANIDDTLPSSSGAFALEMRDSGCGRDGVQGHVNDSRDAS